MNQVLFYGCLALNLFFAVSNFAHGAFFFGLLNVACFVCMLYQLFK
jgi:hypothetical protein